MEETNLKDLVESIIPPLTVDSHKGQAGRIGIIGGSKFYTGAPYFAAISSVKAGADLAYVFCTKDSSSVIKSYSPELLVHPILDNSNFLEEFSEHLPYLHSLIIGPGLGRDASLFQLTRDIVTLAKAKDVPIVLDADALFFLNKAPEIIQSYKKAVLTPNKIEFSRLYKVVTNSHLEQEEYTQSEVENLAKLLGNVTIVKKGSNDIISDGINTVICNETGSLRRCGGQGDILSGFLGTFHYWAYKMSSALNSRNSLLNPSIVAALGACMLTKKCNYLAFQKFGRSTLTTNMISEIHNAFSSLFG